MHGVAGRVTGSSVVVGTGAGGVATGVTTGGVVTVTVGLGELGELGELGGEVGGELDGDGWGEIVAAAWGAGGLLE
jgi:hypothetical protein